MLRRPPTQIQLTAEDIAQYEDNRIRRQAAAAAAQAAHHNAYGAAEPDPAQRGKSFNPNDELKPHPGDKTRQVRYGSMSAQAGNIGAAAQAQERSREERIGIGR